MPHPALSSPTPLLARFLAQSPDGRFHTIATVAEAAQFLTRLPRRHDGLVWALAGSALEHADDPRPNALPHATDAFAVALQDDDLLFLAIPA